ncbi:Small-conductance mechanosensitive channel [uncultured Clostridium sp.]|uniref:mechanosensitive ion channel family protein n=1 Tax=Enterocloster citroniae TaxID=358743 RepID=UPI000820C4D3|nr:mechanosensitive ion channel family protein [Enterocloster citroniae]MBS1483566.1 mechanosensitive ion channel family protein [Clostridium sp.]SCH27470.1 Small-conductance mechanosensitive channel [uncultured Clostridium sp.]
MELLLIKIAVIAVLWSAGMFALNKIFSMILKRKEQIHIKFLRSISKVLLSIMACICISGLFTTTKALSATLLTSSSLLVAIVGFAAQQVLADVISGVMLSWSRPFNLGEKVNISSLGISGIVEDLTVRHTVIRTYHNSRMIIPNSVINKAIVENSNYNNDYIGNYMEIAVSYESDLDHAIEVMRDTIASHPLVADIREDMTVGNKVNVAVKELAQDGIILKATVWTENIDDNFTACSEIRRLIKMNFDAEGISIPYRHVHVVTSTSGEL